MQELHKLLKEHPKMSHKQFAKWWKAHLASLSDERLAEIMRPFAALAAWLAPEMGRAASR